MEHSPCSLLAEAALQRLAGVISEYNHAACLQRGFPLTDSSPNASQPWDCDFGAVALHFGKHCMVMVERALCPQVGLLATRVAASIEGLRENGTSNAGLGRRTVVLVGDEGVGKTTILNLLLRHSFPGTTTATS